MIYENRDNKHKDRRLIIKFAINGGYYNES